MFYGILHLPPPFPLDFSDELIQLLSAFLEKRPERRLGVTRPKRAGTFLESSRDPGVQRYVSYVSFTSGYASWFLLYTCSRRVT